MANKRDLKKQIHYICGEMAINCIFTRDCFDDVNRDRLNDIIVEIANLQSQSLRHVSISFDKAAHDFESKREYKKQANAYYRKAYKALVDNFNNKLQDIVKEMNAELSPEQREINKKAAQK